MSPISQEQQRALDKRLRQLAIAAQQQPVKSRERQKALAQLIHALQQSGRLVRPRRDQFQGLYNEIYAEALQRLFAHVCEKIGSYDPQRGEVLQWVNFLLDRQFFIEASRELLPTVYKGLDPRSVKRLSLEDLDYSNPSEVNPQLLPLPSQQVLQCLEEDPEGSFQSSHIVDYPTVTFKTIAIKRLQGYSWQEMSAEWEIQVSTLSSFYQRCLAKFAPQLKEYLS